MELLFLPHQVNELQVQLENRKKPLLSLDIIVLYQSVHKYKQLSSQKSEKGTPNKSYKIILKEVLCFSAFLYQGRVQPVLHGLIPRSGTDDNSGPNQILPLIYRPPCNVIFLNFSHEIRETHYDFPFFVLNIYNLVNITSCDKKG